MIIVKVFKMAILTFNDVRQRGMRPGHMMWPKMMATDWTSNRSIEHARFCCEARTEVDDWVRKGMQVFFGIGRTTKEWLNQVGGHQQSTHRCLCVFSRTSLFVDWWADSNSPLGAAMTAEFNINEYKTIKGWNKTKVASWEECKAFRSEPNNGNIQMGSKGVQLAKCVN